MTRSRAFIFSVGSFAVLAVLAVFTDSVAAAILAGAMLIADAIDHRSRRP